MSELGKVFLSWFFGWENSGREIFCDFFRMENADQTQTQTQNSILGTPKFRLKQIPRAGSGNGPCRRRNQGEVKEEHKDKLARSELDKRIKELAGIGNRKLCLLLERLE